MAQHINNEQDAITQLQLKVGANATSTDGNFDYAVNNFFVASTYIYLYENTAPTGWTATTTTGDSLVSAVASGGFYSKAASVCGNWSLDTDINTDAHSHRWSYYSALQNYTWSVDGSSYIMSSTYFGGHTLGKRVKGFVIRMHSADTSDYWDIRSRRWGVDGYTDSDTHDHSFTAGWRPQTAVGIIAFYTGP
jgi:hypothetical protein